METLGNLESFVRSAEAGSFSAAARRMALTPAGVSRNVAVLEGNLGVRLFHRSTRKLTLTEAGEQFLHDIRDDLESLQASIASVSGGRSEPAGTLKISMSPTFGQDHLLPLLPAFLERYPRIRPDWQFENRQVDLVAEGLDAAIGGGIELAPGVVARALAPAHIIAVASPAYMQGREPPADPGDFAELDGILMRASRTGRVRHWVMRNASGAEMQAAPSEAIIVNDPAAMCRAALGVAFVAVPDVLPHLESGALVRLAPGWYADAGSISVYYAGRRLLPAKTRVFVDFVVDAFEKNRLAHRFAAGFGIRHYK